MTMIERFTRPERFLHWTTALTVFFLLGTGFWMWMGWSRGHTLAGFKYGQIHFWVGAIVFVAAPLLFLAFRRRRVDGHETRFNAGQKVNLVAVQAALTFMLASGTVLHFAKAWGLTRDLSNVIKTLHLGSAGLIALLVAGHLLMVLKHWRRIQGMLTGRLPQEALEDRSPAPEEAALAGSP
jgi:cytochrome b subunit of formate dehydrogenase